MLKMGSYLGIVYFIHTTCDYRGEIVTRAWCGEIVVNCLINGRLGYFTMINVNGGCFLQHNGYYITVK